MRSGLKYSKAYPGKHAEKWVRVPGLGTSDLDIPLSQPSSVFIAEIMCHTHFKPTTPFISPSLQGS